MAAPVKIKHVKIEIHKSGTRAIPMAGKLKKNISHLADEERLSGEACWSVSGVKTQQTQVVFSPLTFKKTFFLFPIGRSMKAYPLLGEVVGVVLQIEHTRMSAILRKPQTKCCLEMQNPYNFHALPAWWLRNGVLDEAVRGKRLQRHKKCI